jgi:hypothetical protein
MNANPPPGLCDHCRHARQITSSRGSRFILCERSRFDPRFPRYPGLPVLACAGFEEAPTDPGALDASEREP